MVKVYIDQLGNTIKLQCSPCRIISLVPSITELLFDLTSENRIAAVTDYCVHPASKVLSIPKVGGTKKIDVSYIRNLKPDFVIASKEENIKSQVEEIQTFCPVWVSDVQNLDSAISMIRELGIILEEHENASGIIEKVQFQLDKFTPPDKIRTLYMIWRKPYMTVGKDTFIHDIMTRVGLVNVMGSNRYPVVSSEQISLLSPDLILLSSEPYPFKEHHMAELSKLCPHAAVLLVDGEIFSWYGSRLFHSARYFEELWKRILKEK
ncbi:MAG: ABC transporter substrate-binding protein [Cytophagaceae bacterium]